MSEQIFNERTRNYRNEAIKLMSLQERLYEAHSAGYINETELQIQHQELQSKLNYCRDVIENMNREFCAPLPADYSLEF
jgi:hypothetical protein